MSISISPAITTTPALDSLFPIYYEDLTEEQKQQGVEVITAATEEITGNMSATITPTMDMYVVSNNGEETVFGEKGQPFTVELSDNGAAYLWLGGVADSNTPETAAKIIQVNFAVEKFVDE